MIKQDFRQFFVLRHRRLKSLGAWYLWPNVLHSGSLQARRGRLSQFQFGQWVTAPTHNERESVNVIREQGTRARMVSTPAPLPEICMLFVSIHRLTGGEIRCEL